MLFRSYSIIYTSFLCLFSPPFLSLGRRDVVKYIVWGNGPAICPTYGNRMKLIALLCERFCRHNFRLLVGEYFAEPPCRVLLKFLICILQICGLVVLSFVSTWGKMCFEGFVFTFLLFVCLFCNVCIGSLIFIYLFCSNLQINMWKTLFSHQWLPVIIIRPEITYITLYFRTFSTSR